MSHNPKNPSWWNAVTERRRRFEQVIARVTPPFPKWRLVLRIDPKSREDDPRFWVCVEMDDDIDSRTGQRGYSWEGRKFILDEAMTDSEIIRTAILACKIAADHERDHNIHVDGKSPYDPDMNIPKLAAFAEQNVDEQ